MGKKAKTYVIRQANDLVTAIYDSSDLLAKKVITAVIHESNNVEWNKDNSCYVTLRASELIKFGISKESLRNIDMVLKKLVERSITIYSISQKKKILVFTPFTEGEYQKSKLKIKINERLYPYVKELQKNFTQYHIENIKELKSCYSIRIYEFLKSYLYTGYLKIDLEELKKIFNIENKYSNYAHFREKILDKAQTELKEHCDVYFEYREIKAGNKVDELEFIIKKQHKDYSILALEDSFASAKRDAIAENKDCWFEDYIAATDPLKQKSDLINFVENCRNLAYLPLSEKIKLTKLDSASELELGNKILFREYISILLKQ